MINKRHIKKIFFGVIFVIISIFLISYILVEIQVAKIEKVSAQVIDSTDLDFSNIVQPPKAKYFIQKGSKLPEIKAVSYLIGDMDTGEIILSNNINEILAIASVTKLMTALISLEEITQTDTTQVSRDALYTEGTRGNLNYKEEILISDLLYPLLLVSSNDASEVLAEHVGRKKFFKLMNTKAKEVGMRNTNYDDPSGLSGDNLSTAEDLFLLAQYIQKTHGEIFNITELKNYTANGKSWRNINKLTYRDEYIGGKTGYTDKARLTGVGTYSVPFEGYENRNLSIILLNTTDRTGDINKLFNFIYNDTYFSYDEKVIEATKSNINEANRSKWEIAPYENLVTINWVGDIAPGNPKNGLLENNEIIFKSAGEFLRSGDLTIGNLEGVITDEEYSKRCNPKNEGCYIFYNTSDFAKTLKDSGFDILNIANNHSYDLGSEGFADTTTNLEKFDLIPVGYKNKITYHEVNNINIGFVTFTIKNKLNSVYNMSTVKKLVEESEKNADMTVVTVHMGAEGSKYQHITGEDEYFLGQNRGNPQKIAYTAIDSGADVILGSGPHVVRGIEIYEDKPIIYSAGNFSGHRAFDLNEITKYELGATLTFNENGEWQDGSVTGFKMSTLGNPEFMENQQEFYDVINALSFDDFPTSYVLVNEKGEMLK